MNNNTIRQKNRGLALRLIATGEGLTRSDLVSRVGLSKMSVTNAVADLIRAGYVSERAPVEREGQGRNPVPLELAATAPTVVGLHLFRDEVTATLCDLRLQPLASATAKMDAERARHLSATIFELVDAVMPQDRSRVLGIGVGSVGPLSVRDGMLLDPPNFFGVRNFEVCRLLTERYGMPTQLDNHYDCAALAELWFGCAREFEDFVLVGFSNGVGSGVVMHGEVAYGAGGLTSEVGHVCIDLHGPRCTCGRQGCLEAYAKTPAVEKRVASVCGEPLTLRAFCDRWREREAAGLEHPAGEVALIEELGCEVGCALASVVNVLNPEAIVLAHDAALWPDALVGAISRHVANNRTAKAPLAIVRSSRSPEEHAYSSAAPILKRVFDGEFL